jgi:hypothetical protein
MHELENSGGIPFGNLVHDLDSIDNGKKVSPREIRDHLDLFIPRGLIGAAWTVRGVGNRAWTPCARYGSRRLSRGKDWEVLGAYMECIRREALVAISEEATGNRR